MTSDASRGVARDGLLLRPRAVHRRAVVTLHRRPAVRRRGGRAGRRRVLGTGRDLLAAGQAAARARHRRRGHQGLRVRRDEPDGVRAGHDGAAPRGRQPGRVPRRARGLAMLSIAMCGSEEQKARWLPDMAQMDKLGAFALTEPEHGSDSVALETSARRDGDGWVLNGRKRWIGLGSVADLVVVWARNTEDGQVNGFVVEKGSPGYQARVIEGKVSLRSVWQAEITLENVRVPAGNRLPGRARSRTPAGCWPPPGAPALGGAGPRHRAYDALAVRAGAAPVRRAAGQLPDHPAAAGVDAGGPDRDAAVLPADRPPGRGGG